MLIAVITLSGPSISNNRSHGVNGFRLSLAKARRRVKAIPYSKDYFSANSNYFLPRWAKALYSLSAQAASVPVVTLWRRALSSAITFCHRSPRAGDDSSVISNMSAYATSVLGRSVDVIPIEADKVDLPPANHRPIPLAKLLRPPFDRIFSKEGFKKLVKPEHTAVFASQAKEFFHFKTPSDYIQLLILLIGRKMVRFEDADIPGQLTNGAFGLLKPSGLIRLLIDMRRGNALLHGMKKVQALYEEALSLLPHGEGAQLRSKALDLFSPAMLSSVAGGVTKTESDLSNMFHSIQLPDFMQSYQALPPLPGSAVGMPNVRMVRPLLTTAAMGFVYAPLLAQVIHEATLLPALLREVRLAVPVHGSRRHQRVASLPVDDKGLIPLGRIPKDMLKDSLSPFELARRDFRNRVGTRISFGFFIYIDDHHAIYFDAEVPRQFMAAVADLRLLASIMVYSVVGFGIRASKLKFASAVPSPSLGYVVNLSQPVTVTYAKPEKISSLVQRTLCLVSQARTSMNNGVSFVVEVVFLQHLVHSWVWCIMVRRCLMSVFAEVFRLTTSRSLSGKVVLTIRALEELELAAFLAPLMQGAASPWAQTVGCFDACSSAYGVAYRQASQAVLEELGASVERHGAWSAFSTADDGSPLKARTAGRLACNAMEVSEWLRVDWKLKSDKKWCAARSAKFFSKPYHINFGELLAAEQYVRWCTKQPSRSADRRVVGVGDSMAAIGALAKGRSSIPAMNRVCRRIAALSLTMGMTMSWVWVRSGSNPADGPSRWPVVSKPVRQAGTGWIKDWATESGEARIPGPVRATGHKSPGKRKMRVGSVYKGKIIDIPENVVVRGDVGFGFLSVSRRSAAAYLRAWFAFHEWYIRHRIPGRAFDRSLGQYVWWCMQTGEVSRQQTSNLLACIAILDPHMVASGTLARARRGIRGWKRLVQEDSYLPVPRNMLIACCVELVRRGFHVVVAALLVGFDGYLRHGELTALLVSDVALPGDPRLFVNNGTACVFLRCPKYGSPQWVPIRSALAVAALHKLMARRRKDDLLFGDFTFRLLSLFKEAQVWAGFTKPIFVIHSLRHGGATHDHLNAVFTLEEIMRHGRWKGMECTRRYVQDSQALIMKVAAPKAVSDKVILYAKSDRVAAVWLRLTAWL